MKRFYIITLVMCFLILLLYACGLSIEQSQNAGTILPPYVSSQNIRS